MNSNKKENKPDGPLHAGDHLANERTFLAWIRTSVAIMAFAMLGLNVASENKQFSLT